MIEEQVRQLERTVRILKGVFYSTCLLVIFVTIMGAALPNNDHQVIKAKEFILIDDHGKERAALRIVVDGNEKGPGLVLTDSADIQRFRIAAIEDNSGTNSVRWEMKDKTGKTQIGAEADSSLVNQANIYLRHETGPGIDLTAMTNGAEIEVTHKRTLVAPSVKLFAASGGRGLFISDVKVQGELADTIPEIKIMHEDNGNKITIYDQTKPPLVLKP